MSSKIDIQEVNFEIVDDTYRIRTSDYGELRVVIALLEGKTIAVPENTATDKLYRFARARNKKLRKQLNPIKGLVLWFDEKE